MAAWRAQLLGLDADAPPAHTRLLCQDIDFSAWPLSEPAVLDRLAAWLRRPGRQLHLLGLDFSATERAHPRLARWRRDWAHRLVCASPVQPLTAAWPSCLLGPHSGVLLLDAPHWRARQLVDVVELQALRQQADALAQRCEAAWPITTLGL